MATKTTAAKIATGIYKGNLRKLSSSEDLLEKWQKFLMFLGHHPGMSFPEAIRVFTDRAELEDDSCKGVEFKTFEDWNAQGFRIKQGEHGIVAPAIRGQAGSIRLFGSDQVVSLDGEPYEHKRAYVEECGLALGVVMSDAQGGVPQGSSPVIECALPFAERASAGAFDVIRRRLSRAPFSDEAETVLRGCTASLLARSGQDFGALPPSQSEIGLLADVERLDIVGRALAKAVEVAAGMQDVLAEEIVEAYGRASLPCAAMLSRYGKGGCMRDVKSGWYSIFVERSNGNTDVHMIDENGSVKQMLLIEDDKGYGHSSLLREIGLGEAGFTSVPTSEVLALLDQRARRGRSVGRTYIDILEIAREEGTSTSHERARSSNARALLADRCREFEKRTCASTDAAIAAAQSSWEEALSSKNSDVQARDGFDAAFRAAEKLAGAPLYVPKEVRERVEKGKKGTTPEADEQRARDVAASIAINLPERNISRRR